MSFSEAEAKELISAAKEHTAKQFNDPATAEFEGLYVASRGSVCGKVSAKDQFGAPFGPRDFIFTSNKLVYLHGSMPEDDFALYARLQCQRPRADQ